MNSLYINLVNVQGNVILLCAVHYSYNAPCVEWYIRFVALYIPLILGVKVLHIL